MNEDSLALIDNRIESTWAALLGARKAANHSPNAETMRLEMLMQERLDFLLDKRLRLMTEETVAA